MASLTMLPSQYWDHMIQCVSGNGNTMHALQRQAKPASGQTIYRGALVSLNSDGEFQNGLASATAMPMWAINASDDYDTGGGSMEVGNTTTFGGQMGAYVATGGYELFTTEYVSGQTYTFNTQLTNGTATNVGKVTPASSPANDSAVVGVVSREVTSFSEYQKSTTATTSATSTAPAIGGTQVLYFWPVYLPAITVTDYISDSSTKA
jgi:hypothetical protein